MDLENLFIYSLSYGNGKKSEIDTSISIINMYTTLYVLCEKTLKKSFFLLNIVFTNLSQFNEITDLQSS